ncbi:MAG: M55 family metallopeptidase [Firmicutes bacterium]|nr:M55 family metallopeptidase [Bacillota bacterium]
MRILISVDMEGIAGVTGREEIMRGHHDYERFRHLMTAEANAAIAGAFDGGADSVVVNDSHGGMRNLLYEELDPRAELISGHNKVLTMVEGGQDTQGALFIGYHARAGTGGAVMDHTISGAQVHNWFLNGTPVSEAEINAALLGHYGVPVLLVSGDDKIAREVNERLPGVATAIVKHGMDHRAARALPRSVVLQRLHDASQEAVSTSARAPIHRVPGPVTFRLEFTRSFYAEVASLMPSVVRLDGRTIEVTGQDIVEAWRWASSALRLGSTGDN